MLHAVNRSPLSSSFLFVVGGSIHQLLLTQFSTA
jgi:hypothetical protein